MLAGAEGHEALLRSIVEVARSIFEAKAASVMLFDAEADELVFEAVVGEGEDTLVGQRIPSDTGIAGFVLASGEPLVIEDVNTDPRFARDVAERSGYVPNGLMVVPLMRGEMAIGVLSVLDRPRERFSSAEMHLLAQFGTQAAIALDLLDRSRRAQGVLEGDEPDGGEDDELAGLARALGQIEDPGRRRAALDLVDGLVTLLGELQGPPTIRFRER
ncbi:MAG: GAF domain-containing protein [Thermoleophilales bacterium]|nr:GAF domain-containing protein [Thermoleophilales bacterium]